MLDAPMFGIRWRWNASRALAVVRRRADRRVPAQLQRMQSEDLVAQVFPDQLACLENIPGEREVPDHPLVRQTIHDCLYEAMDIEALENLLQKIKNKEVNLVARDLKEPSPLAYEIVNARPYAFLDDAPFEERRTLAVRSRRSLTPAEANDIGKLDPAAIEAVQKEAWPDVTSADELHDALLLSGLITAQEGTTNHWETYFQELVQAGRATSVGDSAYALWVATERVPFINKIYAGKTLHYPVTVPEKLRHLPDDKDALVELVRGRLEIMGPVTSVKLSEIFNLPLSSLNQALIKLENEGFVFRGNYSTTETEEWCERRLLARIHRYTIKKLRSEIQPVSAADFMRFLFSWHQLDGENQSQGPVALEHVIQKLEGFEAPAVAWESDIFPARVSDYDHQWLDMLSGAGKISWGHFRPSSGKEKKTNSPIRTTAITFVNRNHLHVWKNKLGESNEFGSEYLSPRAMQALEILQRQGASFFDDIVYKTKLFPSQAEDALGELIGAGLITSDSFTGLRALLMPDKYKTNTGHRRDVEIFSMNYAGRWSLLHNDHLPKEHKHPLEGIETIAWALLRRYGVLFRKLAERENLAPPWRDLVRMLRTMEARGQIRGGRFVEGVYGEQFALPEAIIELRKIKKENKTDVLVSISAADPLNLTGVITPGKRVAAFSGNRILYRDGVPVVIKEAKEIQFLIEPDAGHKWPLQNALMKRSVSPKLRKYLGNLSH